MALVIADRVQETTTTTGTGTVTLAGAVTGYQSFAVIGNGNVTYYTITDPATGAWEVGYGTYTSSGTTLSRSTVLASSNANALVPFGAGSKFVFCTYPAGRSVYEDETGKVILLVLSAGTSSANTAPLKFTSGTNLTTPEAGAVEYDGTVVTATSNTDFKRGTIPITNYTSGSSTALSANSEATLQSLLPAANNSITLPIGTYFLDISFFVARGPTSTTSATARLNILGTGTAAGNFSGASVSSITAGGAASVLTFDAANIATSQVLTAASTTASGVYIINLRGTLKITTGGSILPQYNLSANINAANTTNGKVAYFILQQLDSQSAVAFGPAGTGWN